VVITKKIFGVWITVKVFVIGRKLSSICIRWYVVYDKNLHRPIILLWNSEHHYTVRWNVFPVLFVSILRRVNCLWFLIICWINDRDLSHCMKQTYYTAHASIDRLNDLRRDKIPQCIDIAIFLAKVYYRSAFLYTAHHYLKWCNIIEQLFIPADAISYNFQVVYFIGRTQITWLCVALPLYYRPRPPAQSIFCQHGGRGTDLPIPVGVLSHMAPYTLWRCHRLLSWHRLYKSISVSSSCQTLIISAICDGAPFWLLRHWRISVERQSGCGTYPNFFLLNFLRENHNRDHWS